MNVTIDEERFAAAGLGFSRSGDLATFVIPADSDDEQPREVMAPCDGDVVIFFPERSAGQRRIIATLGL